jgi:hypothetical protein
MAVTRAENAPTVRVENGFGERQLMAQTYTDEVTSFDVGPAHEDGLDVIVGSRVVGLEAEHGDWAFEAFALGDDGRIVSLALTATDAHVEIAAPPGGTYVVYVDGLDVHSDVRTVRYIFRWIVPS